MIFFFIGRVAVTNEDHSNMPSLRVISKIHFSHLLLAFVSSHAANSGPNPSPQAWPSCHIPTHFCDRQIILNLHFLLKETDSIQYFQSALFKVEAESSQRPGYKRSKLERRGSRAENPEGGKKGLERMYFKKETVSTQALWWLRHSEISFSIKRELKISS